MPELQDENYNGFAEEASSLFFNLKTNPFFPYAHRLASVTRASSEDFILLQTADLLAYKVFKRLYSSRDSDLQQDVRKPMQKLWENIKYDGGVYFSVNSLGKLKPGIEASVCERNQLVIVPSD